MLCSSIPAAQWPADKLVVAPPASAGIERHIVMPSHEVPRSIETSGTEGPAPDGLTTVVLRGSPPEDQSLRDMAADVDPPPRIFSRRELCSTMAEAATANQLPVPFFANLIWQESGFKPHVVSPAGAQGIAQFMPETASQYGLDNPFDPIRALAASARFLKELLGQFGNVGLAAAAYNAGPKRVQDWIARKSKLPAETRNYVQVITGRSAESWTNAKTARAGHMPGRAPCVEVAEALKAQAEAEAQELAAAKAAAKTPGARALLARAGASQAKAGMQLASESSKPVKLPVASKATKTVTLAETRRSSHGPKIIVLESEKPVTHKRAARTAVATKSKPAARTAAKHPAAGHRGTGRNIEVANAR